MKFSMYTGVYALTLLISAALLFSIQPMFSKMILPLLGGTPQVWNTAMVFFQVTLLAGYAYAHATTRLLGIRLQAIVHILLLIAFASILPFLIPEGEVPPVDKDPTLWQLVVMATIIGGRSLFYREVRPCSRDGSPKQITRIPPTLISCTGQAILAR